MNNQTRCSHTKYSLYFSNHICSLRITLISYNELYIIILLAYRYDFKYNPPIDTRILIPIQKSPQFFSGNLFRK